MRINLNTPGANQISTERTSIAPESASSTGRTSEVDKFAGDTVSLSSLAAQTMQMPAVRRDKVDALRQQIATGDYAIDPRKTADAMLDKSDA
jgi:flagellar biosynthesis anti-sigma factor FlgM